MTRTFLVTGASGFIGGHLVAALLEKGERVRALVRDKNATHLMTHPNLELCVGALEDESALAAACTGVNVVVHSAAAISHHRSDRALMWRTNVDGTRHLLSASVAKKVAKFVHVSSIVTIGALETPTTPLTEESPYTLPHALGYPDSKRAAEILVQDSVQRGELDAVIVNPATVYGTGDARKESRGFQGKVARGALSFYPRGGVNVVSVHDVVAGIIAAEHLGRSGERYVLGGDNIYICELFNLIAECAGVKPPRIPLPTSLLRACGVLGDLLQSIGLPVPLDSDAACTATMYHWFSSEKAKRELGFTARPWQDAVKESVQWMLTHQVK